jgi:hypothetical protein
MASAKKSNVGPINPQPPPFSPVIPGCEGQIGYAHCDRCNVPTPLDAIRIIDGALCLCPLCYQIYCAIPDGCLKSSIRRFLIGNVV